MKLLDFLFSSKKNEKSEKSSHSSGLQKADFYLAGVIYYEKNINKLAKINPDFEKDFSQLCDDDHPIRKVYKYDFRNKPVYLIPEPTNKHDKNAIMVQICGQHVGYIQSDQTQLVQNLLKKNVKYISSYIRGGPYKIVYSNGNENILEEHVSISVRIAYVED